MLIRNERGGLVNVKSKKMTENYVSPYGQRVSKSPRNRVKWKLGKKKEVKRKSEILTFGKNNLEGTSLPEGGNESRETIFRAEIPKKNDKIRIEDFDPKGKFYPKNVGNEFKTDEKRKNTFKPELGEYSPRKEEVNKNKIYDISGRKLDFDNLSPEKKRITAVGDKKLNFDDEDLNLVENDKNEFSFGNSPEIQPYKGRSGESDEEENPLNEKISEKKFENFDELQNPIKEENSEEEQNPIQEENSEEEISPKKNYRKPEYDIFGAEPILHSRRIHSESPSPSRGDSPLKKTLQEIKLKETQPLKKMDYTTPEKPQEKKNKRFLQSTNVKSISPQSLLKFERKLRFKLDTASKKLKEEPRDIATSRISKIKIFHEKISEEKIFEEDKDPVSFTSSPNRARIESPQKPLTPSRRGRIEICSNHPSRSPKKLSFIAASEEESISPEDIKFKTVQYTSPPKSEKRKFAVLFEHSSKLLKENTEDSPFKKTASFCSPETSSMLSSPDKVKLKDLRKLQKKKPKKEKKPDMRKKKKNSSPEKKPVAFSYKNSYADIHLNQTPPKRRKKGRKGGRIRTPRTTAEAKKFKPLTPPPKKLTDKAYTKAIKKGLKRYRTPDRIESKVRNPKVSRLLLNKNRRRKRDEDRVRNLLKREEAQNDLLASALYKEMMNKNIVNLYSNDPAGRDKNYRGEQGMLMDKFDWNLEKEAKKMAMVKRLMRSREPPRRKGRR